MNNSKTPKVVIGVGLAIVYATGLTFLTHRGGHATVVAQSEPAAPAAPAVVEPAPLPEITPPLADASNGVAEATAAAPATAPATAPAAAPVPASNVVKAKPVKVAVSTRSEPAVAAAEAPPPAQPVPVSEPAAKDTPVVAEAPTQVAEVRNLDASAPTINN